MIHEAKVGIFDFKGRGIKTFIHRGSKICISQVNNYVARIYFDTVVCSGEKPFDSHYRVIDSDGDVVALYEQSCMITGTENYRLQYNYNGNWKDMIRIDSSRQSSLTQVSYSF